VGSEKYYGGRKEDFVDFLVHGVILKDAIFARLEVNVEERLARQPILFLVDINIHILPLVLELGWKLVLAEIVILGTFIIGFHLF